MGYPVFIVVPEPVQIVCEAGCCVIAVAAFTVSVALFDVLLPHRLVTIHLYCEPESAIVADDTVRLEFVAPEMFAQAPAASLRCCHWYVPTFAETVKVTLSPVQVVASCGCVLITGAEPCVIINCSVVVCAVSPVAVPVIETVYVPAAS